MKALSSHFSSLRLPQLLFSLPPTITFHCHSSLQSPLNTRAALPSPPLPSLNPSLLFLFFLLNPHKWLSETGQVLQNSPWSATCLIQGLAHCTKTSNTLPTHWEGHSLSLSHKLTHGYHQQPMTISQYNVKMICICIMYIQTDEVTQLCILSLLIQWKSSKTNFHGFWQSFPEYESTLQPWFFLSNTLRPQPINLMKSERD